MVGYRMSEFLIGGHHVDDETELVRGDRTLRLELPHHTVASIDMEADFELIGREIANCFVLNISQDLADTSNHRRTANSRDRDTAIARKPHSLELDPVFVALDETRTRDLHSARTDLLELALGQVHRMTGARLEKRIFTLVERVCRNRRHRGTAIRTARFEQKMIIADYPHHHVHSEGLGGEGAALKDLAHVHGEPRIRSSSNGESGYGGVIAGAATYDYIGTLIQCGRDRLRS